MRNLLSALAILSAATVAMGNQILYDGFDYDPTGNPVLGTPSTAAADFGVWTSQGKQATLGPTLEPVVTAGSLSFPGLPSFGNSALLNNTFGISSPGADGSRLSLGSIDSATAPTLYYSFVVSLPASTNTRVGGAYFAGFDNLTGGTYTSFAGLFVRRDSVDPAKVANGTGDDNKLELGISTSGSANQVFGSTAYTANQPLFVVGSFTFGGVANLDVFTAGDPIPASEPAAHTVSTSGTDASTVTEIKNFYLRGNVSEPDGIQVDELRIGTSWQGILPLAGDTNFDGTIDPDDYALIDRGFAQYQTGGIAPGAAEWVNGDFNFDHAVDAADYLIIDQALLNQGGTLSPSLLAERRAEFGDAYVVALTGSVPEPATLGLVAAGAIGLLAGRRRHA